MASRKPRLSQQPGLEVVPLETGLYPAWAHSARSPKQQPLPIPEATDIESGDIHNDATQPTNQAIRDDRKRILGLTVPVFWIVILILFVVLAGAIGGGIGGGLSTLRKSESKSGSSSSGTGSGDNTDSGTGGDSENGSGSGSGNPPPQPTTLPPSTTSPASTDTILPTDDCPGVNDAVFTPYAADGKPVPLREGGSPQTFREQCWTSWKTSGSTHDILRTYTPTLENCITVCAEYNKAYLRNLEANNGVAGGPCVAVTLVKEHAGFCYLKNGTGSNDTMGHPENYSSAILLTNVDDLLSRD